MQPFSQSPYRGVGSAIVEEHRQLPAAVAFRHKVFALHLQLYILRNLNGLAGFWLRRLISSCLDSH